MNNMNEEELKSYSFYKINNGFDGVSWGGCYLGIRGALNPEILHLFKSGHCEWIFGRFIYSWSGNANEIMKTICRSIVNMNRGQSYRYALSQ